MSHLPTERLAALADESPPAPIAAGELAHLASCDLCAAEREAYRNLLSAAASEAARIGVPLTSWERLAPALSGAGIVSQHGAAPRVRGGRWLQAAAAVLLLTGGVALGRYSSNRLLGASTLAQVSSTAPSDSVAAFQTVDDARNAQIQSQLRYQEATSFIAQHDTAGRSGESPSGMKTRLAALDRVLQTTGAALNEAPYDPVINGYYLTTLGQREATLRQLKTSMPAGVGIVSY